MWRCPERLSAKTSKRSAWAGIAGLYACLGLMLTVGPAHAADEGVAEPPLVRAEALADHAAVTPGQPFALGVRLTMRPGWHIYWRNPGDSGQATSINVSIENHDGLEVGDIRWPLPHRFELDGGLVNFGYDGTVMLSRKITLPDDLGDAEQITLTIDASWLVCEATCIPGGQSLTLTLPIADQPRKSTEHAEAFAAHEASLPATPEAVSDRVSVRWGGGVETQSNAGAWRVRLDWKGQTPAEVQWFPAADEALMLEGPDVTTSQGVTTIEQPATRLAGIKPSARTLTMLVTWREPDGGRRGVNLPVPFFAPAELTEP